MRLLLVGVAIGTALGWAVSSSARIEEPLTGQIQPLSDISVRTAAGASFILPTTYGRLVDVVVSAEMHHLYFEDEQGAIRIVLLGPRGAAQRSRSALQLLSPDVFLVKRGAQAGS